MIEGVLPSAMADYGQSNDSGYERRYASKKMHGRVEYHGQSHEYVNAVPHIPIFKRLSNPANPWDEANELSSLDPLAAVSSVNEKELAWYKKNWFKLDLIDPAKWALFPGDVVRVTNKSHRKLSCAITSKKNSISSRLSQIWPHPPYLRAARARLGLGIEPDRAPGWHTNGVRSRSASEAIQLSVSLKSV